MRVQKLGIVGFGVVGETHYDAFIGAGIDTFVFDKFDSRFSDVSHQIINECDLVFVCVPTPSREDGSCDLSAVEEVVSWVSSPMCIKSTVPPGTTDRLIRQFGKKIVFSPEYTGETAFHPYRGRLSADVIAIGGCNETADLVVRIYSQILGPEPVYFVTNAATAELAKYMENCFFATKVAFVAQFYLLAELFGANFTTLREIWVADKRIGRSHSTVVGLPGFSGRCLPKDLSALLVATRQAGGRSDLLESVDAFNRFVRSQFNSEDLPVQKGASG